MYLQWKEATDDEIVQFCRKPDLVKVGQLGWGLRVIKISEDAVVKLGVTRCEAANQHLAYEILARFNIPVPQVYRYFDSGRTGYLIMEYIDGQPLSTIENPDMYLEPMAKILKVFEGVQRDKPGPFHDGLAEGKLWMSHWPIAPATIADIEKYYNTKQLKNSTSIKLSDYPLVFCHLDIAPRNILVLEDNSLCLIDWNSGGFYPRLFERTGIDINIRGVDSWNTKLLKLLDELDEGEKCQAQLLERAYYLSVKYA